VSTNHFGTKKKDNSDWKINKGGNGEHHHVSDRRRRQSAHNDDDETRRGGIKIGNERNETNVLYPVNSSIWLTSTGRQSMTGRDIDLTLDSTISAPY
jgi:hypothetical protein